MEGSEAQTEYLKNSDEFLRKTIFPYHIEEAKWKLLYILSI